MLLIISYPPPLCIASLWRAQHFLESRYSNVLYSKGVFLYARKEKSSITFQLSYTSLLYKCSEHCFTSLCERWDGQDI